MKIKLREINESDIKQINNWRNDKELIDYLGANFLYTSEVIDSLWFQNYLKNRDKAIRLAIEDVENQMYIGNVYLTNIHNINRSAEFSIFIGNKDYLNQAIGMNITSEVIKHGFNDLNLNRIYLYVINGNERAINLYRKLGFKDEGVLREAIYKNGKFIDFLVMSILKKEWNHIKNDRHEVSWEL